jgi:hypothetical protein
MVRLAAVGSKLVGVGFGQATGRSRRVTEAATTNIGD